MGKLIIHGSQKISKFSHLIAYVGGKEEKRKNQPVLVSVV
jgi:hypothetical protein